MTTALQVEQYQGLDKTISLPSKTLENKKDDKWYLLCPVALPESPKEVTLSLPSSKSHQMTSQSLFISLLSPWKIFHTSPPYDVTNSPLDT